jgi:hypothetical protein
MKNLINPTALLAIMLILASCQTQQTSEPEKVRTVILTDMTHDDGNSLIRYLYYASEFDLEALIVTNQLPDFNHDDTGPWEKAMSILDAYQLELPQLRKHDPDLPAYEDLMAVTKQGRGALPIIWLTNTLEFSNWIADRHVTSSWDSVYFHDWIGEGLTPHGEPKDSDGSEFPVCRFLKRTMTALSTFRPGVAPSPLYRLCTVSVKNTVKKNSRHFFPKSICSAFFSRTSAFEYFASFEKMQNETCAGFRNRNTYLRRRACCLGKGAV